MMLVRTAPRTSSATMFGSVFAIVNESDTAPMPSTAVMASAFKNPVTRLMSVGSASDPVVSSSRASERSAASNPACAGRSTGPPTTGPGPTTGSVPVSDGSSALSSAASS